MAKLPRYILSYDEKTNKWVLTSASTSRVVKFFSTKADAIKGGVLESSLGRGTVQIRGRDGRIKEERTYPRAADPKARRG